MESETTLTPREKSPLPEAQRRFEHARLHEAGQWAQHTTDWVILIPRRQLMTCMTRGCSCQWCVVWWQFPSQVAACLGDPVLQHLMAYAGDRVVTARFLFWLQHALTEGMFSSISSMSFCTVTQGVVQCICVCKKTQSKSHGLELHTEQGFCYMDEKKWSYMLYWQKRMWPVMVEIDRRKWSNLVDRRKNVTSFDGNWQKKMVWPGWQKRQCNPVVL